MASKLTKLEAELKWGGASKEEIALTRKNAIQTMAANHSAGKNYKVEKLPNTVARADKDQSQSQRDQGRSRDSGNSLPTPSGHPPVPT